MIERRKTKSQRSQRPIDTKGEITGSYSNGKRESTSVLIGLNFSFDWSVGKGDFFKPITVGGEANPMHSRVAFYTQLKIALRNLSVYRRSCRHIFGELMFCFNLKKTEDSKCIL